MSPDTLEQRIREALTPSCTHRVTGLCFHCQIEAKWARKKAPDIARALEAAMCRMPVLRDDGWDADETARREMEDAFIAELSRNK